MIAADSASSTPAGRRSEGSLVFTLMALRVADAAADPRWSSLANHLHGLTAQAAAGDDGIGCRACGSAWDVYRPIAAVVVISVVRGGTAQGAAPICAACFAAGTWARPIADLTGQQLGLRNVRPLGVLQSGGRA